ncbi:MAG: TetR/AcrR family transcriptional regulator [Myxococcota bacterium]
MQTTDTLQPRKSPAQARSARTVDDLLDATARVLLRDGWDKVSTNRIAKAAGVSVGSLYQYFPNKEALMLALATRHAEQTLSEFVEHAGVLADAPLEVAVPAFVQAMIDGHRSDPELHVALVHQLLAVGLEPVDRMVQAAKQVVLAFLERRRHELAVTNLDLAAWMCVTTVDTVVHAAVLDRKRLDDPALAAELSAMILRYLTGRG